MVSCMNGTPFLTYDPHPRSRFELGLLDQQASARSTELPRPHSRYRKKSYDVIRRWHGLAKSIYTGSQPMFALRS